MIEGELHNAMSDGAECFVPSLENTVRFPCFDCIRGALTTIEDAAIATRLPVEILRKILEEVADTWLTEDRTPERVRTISTAQEWLNTMLVCQHWRQVALGDPLLWATVAPNFSRRAGSDLASLAERLVRSGDVPLQMDIRGPERANMRTLAKLASCSGRFRSFRVYSSGALERLGIFQAEAPKLEIMHIGRSNASFDGELPTLFGGEVASLRYLSLHNVARLGDNKFHDLAYIHLSHQHYTTAREKATVACIADLIDMLKLSRRLKTCIFRSCDVADPHLMRHSNAKADRVDLPALRRLAYSNCSAGFTAITLCNLHLSSRRLALSVDHRGFESFLDEHVASRLRPLLDGGVYKIAFMCPSQHGQSAGQGPALANVLVTQPASALQFTLRQQPNIVDCPVLRGTRSCLRSVPLNVLRELWLCGKEHSPTIEWQAFFGEQQSITKLVIDFSDIADPPDARCLLALGLVTPRWTPTPALHALVCLAFPVWQKSLVSALRSTMQRRDDFGRRVMLLHVQRQQGGKNGARLDQQAEWDWEIAKDHMKSYVHEVRDEIVQTFPRVNLPEVCRAYPEFESLSSFM